MRTFDGVAAACRGTNLRLAAAAGLAGLSLAACASVSPEIAATAPPPAPVAGIVAASPPLQVQPKPAAMAAAPAPKSRTKKGAAVARNKVGSPYRVAGALYVPADQPDYDEVGIASWYGEEFNGRHTADGERFDMYSASAAHTTLPLPSIVEVTNLENGRSIRVRLNDRGPFKAGRLIDLSRGAAQQLGYLNKGLARVRVRYVGPARPDGSLEPLYVAQASPAANAALRLASASTKAQPAAVEAVWRAKPPIYPRAELPADSAFLVKASAARPVAEPAPAPVEQKTRRDPIQTASQPPIYPASGLATPDRDLLVKASMATSASEPVRVAAASPAAPQTASRSTWRKPPIYPRASESLENDLLRRTSAIAPGACANAAVAANTQLPPLW